MSYLEHRVAEHWCEGRFRIEQQIGRGAMGVVYRAFDKASGKAVAIKTVRAQSPATLYRLKQEFRVLADLYHHNLVSILELAHHDNNWFFVMELIDGVELSSFVELQRLSSASGRFAAPRPFDPDAPEGGSTSATAASDATDGLVDSTATESNADFPSVLSSLRAETQTGQGSVGEGLHGTASVGPLATKPTMEATGPEASDRGKDENVLPKERRAVACDVHKLRDALPQLIEGLHALHSKGLLHRDVKPSNVMVTRERRVVLFDFGVSTDAEDQGNTIAGTPAYMAPEVLRRERAGTYSDWYALGATLYHLLTGKTIDRFRGSVWDAPTSPPPPPSLLVEGVPPDLEELCMGLLRQPTKRRFKYEDACRTLGMTPTQRSLTAGASGQKGEFAGRSEQLRTLRLAFTRSQQELSLALVSGPSGMGKSMLVEHFIESCRESGAIVLRGRCYVNESVPYKGFDALVDALANVLGALPSDELERVRPRGLLALAQVFPVLTKVLGDDDSYELPRDPHVARREAFEAFREILASLASIRPVVCYVDDLQWGDHDSAAMLGALIRTAEQPRVLFVGTYRSDESDNVLIREVLDDPERRLRFGQVHEIDVGPLTKGEARAILAHMPESQVLPREAREVLIREAEGSPFFLRELAFYTLEHPEMHSATVNLDGLLMARTTELGREVQTVLETIALAVRPQNVERVFRVHGLSSERARILHELRVARLVAMSQVGGQELVECYHDRIRETVVAGMSVDEVQRRHLALAESIESTESSEYELLAEHYAGAGIADKSARYVRLAADEAMRTLAFDRAATLYRRALRYTFQDSAEAGALRRLLAKALVHAGRNGEAAAEFLSLSQRSEGAERLHDLRMAFQYLIASGETEQGLELLSEVLADAKEAVPPTPKRALGRLVYTRARLALGKHKFTPRSHEEISATERAAIDALWSAGLTLVFVDNFRSAYFLSRCLLRALAAGDSYRVARALFLEVGFGGTSGEKSFERSTAVLEHAERLAEESGDAYLKLLVGLTHANYHFQVTGDFVTGLDASTRGLRALRAHPNLAYERVTIASHALWFLYYLGRPRELREMALGVARDAESRADRYALSNTAAGLPSFHWLAFDEADKARSGCEQVLHDNASENGAQMQYYYAVFGLAQVELYEGNGAAAHTRLVESWSRLKRSMLLRVDMILLSLGHARARGALMAARDTEDPAERKRLLADVRRTLKNFRGRTNAVKVVMRESLSGALKAAEGDFEAARRHLEAAEVEGLEAELFLLAMASRAARATLLDDEEGRALGENAREAIRDRGVVSPDRIIDMFVPMPLRPGDSER